MNTGELSTGTPTVSKCCKATEVWRDCEFKGHEEGCFVTYCETCNWVTYRDCIEGRKR
jgi:hypothetical protein